LPDIITPNNNELSDEDKEAFLTCYTDALKELDVCRINEGKIMMNDILLHISNIETKLQTVEIHETARIDKIRASINSALTNIEINTEIDRNRFEQELIYYLEKLDITEEKIRLKQHCVFFRQTSTEEVPGRKLVFISQEIGREINTIGSKACDANIQRIVVEMKDELEKIKEQLCNIL
jgi:uncharacterized protein (TIGR00255 family)